MDQDGTWHAGRPQPRRLCVRWVPSSPPQGGGAEPLPNFRFFSAHVYCGQTTEWIKMVLGTEVSLSPDDFVLDGDRAPSPKRGRSPQFSAYVYCRQTAAWITLMPFGTEVGLGPDNIVLDVIQAPASLQKGADPPPQFPVHVYSGQTAGWIKIALGTEVELGTQERGQNPPPPIYGPFYSAPQCSHCKRCTSYGNCVRPSVCLSVCPSVTRRYCVKTTACSTVQFALSYSKMCLVL